jgi:hypothetical protein
MTPCTVDSNEDGGSDVPVKCWYLHTNLMSVISQKVAIFVRVFEGNSIVPNTNHRLKYKSP